MPVFDTVGWSEVAKVLSPKMTLATLLDAKREIDTITGKRKTIKDRTIAALKARRPRLGDFSQFVFPVIQNMAERDVVNELVAVQPMALPAGQVFYMDIVGPQPPRNYVRNRSRVLNLERLVLQIEELRQSRDDILALYGPDPAQKDTVAFLTHRIRQLEDRIAREQRVVRV